ncbi:MAG: hypothetical protein IJS14_03910 [Lentisphaeria bacterium]|nr:hypothetical protein [Lentisphaeria bacterium]
MKKVFVSADFSHSLKQKIKPLHGVNNSPLSLYQPPMGFKEAGIPFCRLHDTAGAYGGAHYVDIPNVFPDFEADPRKPESYDFAFTDAYLKQIRAAGTQIFYRLGVTIENNYRIKGYHNHPPKDFKKWAEICAGIVRHYNHGWANGLKLGIEYWEIWNEPENPPMWDGTREQFFELYRIASKRLKKEFPEIKVGGYASCGFYAINREDCKTREFHRSFLAWFDDFLKFVTTKRTACPLDFFSWHLYTGDPAEIVLHAQYADRKLKEYGLDKLENIIDEWNYVSGKPGRLFFEMRDHEGASFVTSAFCRMQDSPIDKALYYDAYPQRAYCGLYHFPGPRTTKTYSVFFMWNILYRLKKQCKAVSDDPAVQVCAASDGKDCALLITNFSPKGRRADLKVSGVPLKKFRGEIIDSRRNRTGLVPAATMILPPYSTVLLTTTLPEEKTVPKAEVKNHAGLDDTAARKGKK